MNKIILISILLCPILANADWLMESKAKPLEIDLNSSRTIIVCTSSTVCQSIIVYGE